MHGPPWTMRFLGAVWAGLIAGVLSAFVKLGWEQLLPPRTPDRAEPPVILLQHLGLPVDSFVFTFSGTEVNWGSLVVHFAFSIAAVVLYAVLAEFVPVVRIGFGAVYGIAVWAVFHLGVLPAMGLTPGLQALPLEEHVSEIAGHVVWLVSAELIRRGVLLRKRLKAQPVFA